MDNNNNAGRPDEKKQEDEEQDKKNSSDSASHPKLDPKDITPTSTATAPPLSREGNSGSFDMQTQSQSQSQSQSDPLKVKSPSAPSKSVTWSSELTSEAPSVSQASSMNVSSSPYVSAPSPAQSSSSSVKNTMHTVRDVLGRWGKKAGDTTKKGQDLAGNLWQHLKTGPSFTDAAMGRIAQGTKVIVEGGYEKIFQHTFDTIPEEQLQRSYVCYLSTSAGPVMGILYLSTAKLAFCSDNPLSYQVGDRTEWSYYKVVIPLHQLKAVNSSKSKTSSAEKYIQVVSVDNHEFWFMGFVNYDSAVKCLQESLQARDLQAG